VSLFGLCSCVSSRELKLDIASLIVEVAFTIVFNILDCFSFSALISTDSVFDKIFSLEFSCDIGSSSSKVAVPFFFFLVFFLITE